MGNMSKQYQGPFTFMSSPSNRIAIFVLMGTLFLGELSRPAGQAAASGTVNVVQPKEQVAPEFNRGLDWFDPKVNRILSDSQSVETFS